MALGTGASFTGIGAIGGVPAVAVGAILLGFAVGVGLLMAGVKYYVAKKQEKKINKLEFVTETFATANAHTHALKSEVQESKRIAEEDALRAEKQELVKQLKEEKGRAAEKDREIEKMKQELEAARQKLKQSKKEKVSKDAITVDSQHLSETYEGLNSIGMFHVETPHTPTRTASNDPILQDNSDEKKTLDS
jgi:hypothetical protein